MAFSLCGPAVFVGHSLSGPVAAAAAARFPGLALGRSPLRSVVEMAVTLPLIFSPIAIGFALLMLLGRRSATGGWLLDTWGLEIVFSFWGLMTASFVAGLPQVVRPVQSAIRSLPDRLTEAALVLGKTPAQAFFLVVLPNVRRTLAAGMIPALGRSLGEAGITMMLGGNIIGLTNTFSLEIYYAVSTGEFEPRVAELPVGRGRLRHLPGPQAPGRALSETKDPAGTNSPGGV